MTFSDEGSEDDGSDDVTGGGSNGMVELGDEGTEKARPGSRAKLNLTQPPAKECYQR